MLQKEEKKGIQEDWYDPQRSILRGEKRTQILNKQLDWAKNRAPVNLERGFPDALEDEANDQ